MRPYLAIIVDSFREALHSRVLWLLGAVITLLLIGLAPLGYEERLTVDLADNAARDWPQFLLHLRKTAADDPRGPASRIVQRLEKGPRKKLDEFKLPEEGDISGAMRFIRHVGDLRKAINNDLKRRDFYDAEVWRDTPLASEEGRVLLQRGVDKLNDDELARLNLLLLEAAFPEHLEASPPVSLQIRYAVWDALSPLPFRRDQFTKGVEWVVAWIMKWFVGLVGVVVAILVTSSVIPQMFDPGSLNLLLSKPISRSLLFLSKFIGGCAFILCNAAYLISGLWLILGLRFGIWDAKLLLTIPIYLFMFAIYYTVSSLAGVIWRNAIVSIALSVLFWLICFTVGVSKWLIETRYIEKQRIVKVLPAGDSLIATNEMGLTVGWDADTASWRKVFQSDLQRQLEVPMYFMDKIPSEIRPIGPVYDADRRRLISVQRSFRNGQMIVYTGKEEDKWASRNGPTASIGTVALVQEPQGGVLGVSSLGLFRLVGDASAKPAPLKVLGFSLPLPAVDPFQSVGPDPPVLIARPSAVAVHPDSGDLAIYSRSQLTLLRRTEDGRYARRLEKKLPLDAGQAVVIGWTGRTVLLGRDDGALVLYDDETLEPQSHWLTEGRQPPRFIDAAPGGRWFAVVLHGGKLWMIDTQEGTAQVPRFARAGEVSGANFDRDGGLWVADQGSRVSKYSLDDASLIERRSPVPGVVDVLYRYFFKPVYTIFPKPGELDQTVEYLLSGRKTVDDNSRDRNDLSAAREQLNPWGPVWSSAAFVVVMLALSCLYLERQEF